MVIVMKPAECGHPTTTDTLSGQIVCPDCYSLIPPATGNPPPAPRPSRQDDGRTAIDRPWRIPPRG